MKQHFDIERSLRENPPSYPDGVNFKKRIVTNRENLTRNKQARLLLTRPENVAKIRQSYEVNGFLYDQPVQVVEDNKKDSRKKDILGGYNRDAAQEELNWETTIVDVVEFDSPRARREFIYIDNHILNPRTGNTRDDILKGLSDGIAEGSIDISDDADIKSFISVAAGDMTEEQQENIFNSFRKEHSPFQSMRPFIARTAAAWLKENGYQHQGVKNRNVDGIAYARPTGFSKGAFWDGLELSRKKSVDRYTSVTIYGYIESPKPSQLQADRKAWLKEFSKMNSKVKEICQYAMTLDTQEVNEKVISVFKFGGFLPQNIGLNSHGQVEETGLVDEFGNPFIGE
jgi:hypothetical protein